MIGSKVMDQCSTCLAAHWGQPFCAYYPACTLCPNQLVVPVWMYVIFNSSCIIFNILPHHVSYYVKKQ